MKRGQRKGARNLKGNFQNRAQVFLQISNKDRKKELTFQIYA